MQLPQTNMFPTFYCIPESSYCIPESRDACAVAIEYGIDEESVIFSRNTRSIFSTGQQLLDPDPLVITQGIAFSYWTIPSVSFSSGPMASLPIKCNKSGQLSTRPSYGRKIVASRSGAIRKPAVSVSWLTTSSKDWIFPEAFARSRIPQTPVT